MRTLVSTLLAASLAAAIVACGDATPPPNVPAAPKPHPHAHPSHPVTEPIAPSAYTAGGPSYDEAMGVPEDLNATKNSPELSDRDLSSPMASGEVISECGAPDDMKLVVKVAVVDGKAAGVTVFTKPESPEVASCVDKAVRAMSWPRSSKRFAFTTAY